MTDTAERRAIEVDRKRRGDDGWGGFWRSQIKQYPTIAALGFGCWWLAGLYVGANDRTLECYKTQVSDTAVEFDRVAEND